MRNYRVQGLAVALGSCLLAMMLSGSVFAASLHQASLGSSGEAAEVTGSLPGQVLWAYYLTTQTGEACPPDSNTTAPILCNVEGRGDNIIRLVNPNGAANANLSGAKTETVCAMIYVFDDDQELGECCGCPLSSTQLATFSVETNLSSDWALPGSLAAPGNGSIGIVAAVPNVAATCKGQSGACNGGCDPTNVPGYSVTTASNVLGSITHNQAIAPESRARIDEIRLYDDGGGDPTNLIYLQLQCGALVGNDSGGGICNCPTEG